MSHNLSSIPSLTDTETFVLPLICWATVSNAAELFVGIHLYIVMCILEEIASQKQKGWLGGMCNCSTNRYYRIILSKSCNSARLCWQCMVYWEVSNKSRKKQESEIKLGVKINLWILIYCEKFLHHFVNKPAYIISSSFALQKYLLLATLTICSISSQLITEDMTTNPSVVIMSCHSRLSLSSTTSRWKSSNLESNPRVQIPAIYLLTNCVALSLREVLSFSFICKMSIMLLSLWVSRIINNIMHVKPLEEYLAHTATG